MSALNRLPPAFAQFDQLVCTSVAHMLPGGWSDDRSSPALPRILLLDSTDGVPCIDSVLPLPVSKGETLRMYVDRHQQLLDSTEVAYLLIPPPKEIATNPLISYMGSPLLAIPFHNGRRLEEVLVLHDDIVSPPPGTQLRTDLLDATDQCSDSSPFTTTIEDLRTQLLASAVKASRLAGDAQQEISDLLTGAITRLSDNAYVRLNEHKGHYLAALAIEWGETISHLAETEGLLAEAETKGVAERQAAETRQVRALTQQVAHLTDSLRHSQTQVHAERQTTVDLRKQLKTLQSAGVATINGDGLASRLRSLYAI